MKYFISCILILSSFYVSAQKDITFVGHRGASYLAPENTIESISLAWELGAKAAECDVMLTKDNQVVVIHDNKGKRLTGHDFEVKEVNYSEIKEYPILLSKSNEKKFEGATIPLLEDLLATIPDDGTLVIEIKIGPEILPYLKEVISEHWKTGNIAFIAFNFETIMATKELYPDIPCYYLSMFKADLNKKHDLIVESKLDGVNLRHKIIDKKLVKKYKKAGKNIWCWTVDEPEDAKKMIGLGVTGITTNRPVWLPEQLSQ